MSKENQKTEGLQQVTALGDKDTGINTFVTVVFIILGVFLLLGPMWILQYMTDNGKRLKVITGFVLLFTSLLASATVAMPFEVLAATAAYVIC